MKSNEPKVECREEYGVPQVWIAGKQRPYHKTSDGYTLYDDAYAPPCPTLQEAAKQYEEGIPPTTPPQPSERIRKDFLDLTVDQRNRLADALNQLYNSGRYPVYPDTHVAGWFNIHRGPAFLPWHRWYVLTLEEELRAIDSEITVPYWDWTRDGARDLDVEPLKSFFGGRSNTGGKFDHWSYTRAASPGGTTLPRLDFIIDELQATTYVAYRGEEFGSHVPGHPWTGGNMSSQRSPADPLFFLHHCMVDRLWAIWQINHTSVAQYSLADLPSYPRYPATYVAQTDLMFDGALGGAVTPGSMLDHSALGYGYAKDKRLEDRVVARGLPPIITTLAVTATMM